MPDRAVLGSNLIRAVAVGLSIVACAWFAIGIRQAHDTAKATSILSQTAPINVARVSSLLSEAKLLNPDREVDLLRAELAIRAGDRAQARRVIDSVAHAEPMNVRAWVLLAKASSDDVSEFLRALLNINALEPRVRRAAS